MRYVGLRWILRFAGIVFASDGEKDTGRFFVFSINQGIDKHRNCLNLIICHQVAFSSRHETENCLTGTNKKEEQKFFKINLQQRRIIWEILLFFVFIE